VELNSRPVETASSFRFPLPVGSPPLPNSKARPRGAVLPEKGQVTRANPKAATQETKRRSPRRISIDMGASGKWISQSHSRQQGFESGNLEGGTVDRHPTSRPAPQLATTNKYYPSRRSRTKSLTVAMVLHENFRAPRRLLISNFRGRPRSPPHPEALDRLIAKILSSRAEGIGEILGESRRRLPQRPQKIAASPSTSLPSQKPANPTRQEIINLESFSRPSKRQASTFTSNP